MSKQPKQTGPITPMGKIKSSKNARKSNLFTMGYLETEDIEAKKIEFEALCQQWAAQDNPTMLKILSTIEQASLGMDRLRIAEKHKIEGKMQSSTIQQLFVKEAGLNLITASKLPHWFFLEVDCDEKKLALYIDKVWLQAHHLKENFSDHIVRQLQNDYPDLFDYIMHQEAPNTSFLHVLGQTYKQSTPVANLASLMNDIKNDYDMHLLWASNHQRYQLIINGLKYGLMLEAMDLEKTNRYMTTFQNRIMKAVQMAIFLKEKENTVFFKKINTAIDDQHNGDHQKTLLEAS